MFRHLEHADFTAILKWSHSIKGAGGGYGLDYISEEARQIELAALAEDAKNIRKNLKALEDYTHKVQPIYS